MALLIIEAEVEELNDKELERIIENIKNIEKIKKINVYEYRA